MIKPSTDLPWVVYTEDDMDMPKDVIYSIGNQRISACDIGIEEPCTKQNGYKDALYIVEACNKFPKLVDFLQRIESETDDKRIAFKIRAYLTKNNLWNE